jgi:hypothetical protein
MYCTQKYREIQAFFLFSGKRSSEEEAKPSLGRFFQGHVFFLFVGSQTNNRPGDGFYVSVYSYCEKTLNLPCIFLRESEIVPETISAEAGLLYSQTPQNMNYFAVSQQNRAL